MLRVGRLLTNRLCAMHIPTPDERANRYASLTPIAVLSAAPGGRSPDRGATTGDSFRQWSPAAGGGLTARRWGHV